MTNSLAVLGARLLVPLFSFGINIGVARLLGRDVLGQYVELVALSLVAQAFAGGGISVLMTREVAAHPDDRRALFGSANRVGLATGALATLLFLAYARLLLSSDVFGAAVVLAASILPSAWISAQEGLFMGTNEHPRITLVALVEGFVKLALAGAVLVLGGGLLGLCAGLTAGRLVGLALGRALAAGPSGKAGPRTPGGARAFGRAVVPFTAMMTLGILYFRQDVLIVGALRSESETGFYGVAITLYTLTLLAPNSVMAAVYPRLSETFSTARDRFRDASLLASKLLAVGGALLAIAVVAAGPFAVRWIYGEPYADAVPVLLLLAAVLPLHGVNAALGQAMQAAHLQNEMTALTAGAVAVNLALNLVLVPALGIQGAAVSLFASSTLSAVALAWIFHRQVSPLDIGPRAAAMILAVAVPVALPLLAPPSLRVAVAGGSLALLAALARLSGLIGAHDIAELGRGFGGGRAAESSGA